MSTNSLPDYLTIAGAFVPVPSLPVGDFRRKACCLRGSTAKRLRTVASASSIEGILRTLCGALSRRDFLSLATGLGLHAILLPSSVKARENVKSAYDIVASKDGSPLPLNTFSGKVTLFVNVATYCALTPQYQGLVSLHGKFQPRGFEIVASPCDQFGRQEPGSNQEICTFAREQFGARFLLLDKLNVNDGPGGVAPLYQFLRNASPEDTGRRVSWNFEKFLVGADGRVLRRYKPGVLPAEIDGDVAWALDHPGKELPTKKKPSLGVE